MTAGQYRDKRGGDIALRGVGMAIFARAYLYCREQGMDFDTMAAQLATIDWHVLTCERDELPKEPALYAGAVKDKALPMWGHLLAVGEAGYRIRSSSRKTRTRRVDQDSRPIVFDREHFPGRVIQ